MNVTSKLPEVGTTIFTIMSTLAAEHNAINLSQGFPDFDVDQTLKDLVNKYLQDGFNQYAPMMGIPELRQAIAQKKELLYGRKIYVDTEVTITNGATEALYSAISAFVRPGDEVVIFEPAYDSYIPAIRVNGGIPKPIRLKSPDYRIDWNEVEDTISERTRMLMINSPHNPTGSVLAKEDMETLQKIMVDREIVLLSDEVYQHLIYDGLTHQSVLSYPDLARKSIVAMSFGKTFHATGWRIGYAIAPAELMSEVRKVHQFNTFSINRPLQHALADYLGNPDHYLSLPTFFQEKETFLSEESKEVNSISYHVAAPTLYWLLTDGFLNWVTRNLPGGLRANMGLQ